MIKVDGISKIIDSLRKKVNFSPHIEITLESNPEDITAEKLDEWRSTGINRLSIGVQSLDNDVLRTIRRGLNSTDLISKIVLAQKHFDNVGIDLISGLPNDDIDSLTTTLRDIIDLSPNHISVYDLETDNDSVIGQNPDKYSLPKEEESVKMLISAWNLLEEHGYEQYEISNFAKNRAYCRHNLDFWKGCDYLGFGLGATSKTAETITTNSNNFGEYISGVNHKTEETLTDYEEKCLRLLTAMRLNTSFKNELIAVLGNAAIPLDIATARLINSRFTLTQKGKLVLNTIYERLLQA